MVLSLAELRVKSTFLQQIIELQKNNSQLKLKRELIDMGQTIEFNNEDDDNLYFKGHLCIPNDVTLK